MPIERLHSAIIVEKRKKEVGFSLQGITIVQANLERILNANEGWYLQLISPFLHFTQQFIFPNNQG